MTQSYRITNLKKALQGMSELHARFKNDGGLDSAALELLLKLTGAANTEIKNFGFPTPAEIDELKKIVAVAGIGIKPEIDKIRHIIANHE